MKGKRGIYLVLIMILLMIVLFSVSVSGLIGPCPSPNCGCAGSNQCADDWELCVAGDICDAGYVCEVSASGADCVFPVPPVVKACNDQNGIYCDTISGQPDNCVRPTAATGYGGIDCTVSSNQAIKRTASYSDFIYAFNSLTVASSGSLKFLQDQNLVTTTGNPYSRNPGSKGLAGTPQNLGIGGGDGSDGAFVIKKPGSPSPGEFGIWDCHGYAGNIPGWVGGKVKIYSRTIVINGDLDLSGSTGGTGGNARCHYNFPGGDHYGYGGGGGAGGSGGGELEIVSLNDITGSGNINLDGGKGGTGGQFNDEDGGQCGGNNDKGSGGGGGGGAAGGVVLTSNTVSGSITIVCSGGQGGGGGCPGWAEQGLPGSVGEPINGQGSTCVVSPPAVGCVDYDWAIGTWSDSRVPYVLQDSFMRYTFQDGSTTNYGDYCINSFVLKEYFCKSNSGSYDRINNDIQPPLTPSELSANVDCTYVYSDGTYDNSAGPTGAICASNRCECPSGEQWLPDGTCGVPCSPDLTAGNTVTGMNGGVRKFEIDRNGKMYLDGTVLYVPTSEIAANGGFIIKKGGTPVAAFDRDGNLRLPDNNNAVVTQNAGSAPFGLFTIQKNGVNMFSIRQDPFSLATEVYSRSCIHEADNAPVGGGKGQV